MNEIATERLKGRPCNPGDVEHIRALLSAPDVQRWLCLPVLDWTEERCEIATMRLTAHWLCHGWGPRLWFAGDRFVGLIGLRFAMLAGHGAVEIAFAVMPAEQRKGYAREALAATLAEAPSIAREVSAAVLRDNLASLHLLRDLGFAEAGRSEEAGRELIILSRSFG
ncbi:MAG TPA: GNAT family N-acetyltransferase [Paracoccaceae bacterium]|nr:GNAT family N-acetyltransferase [Paracoccaceae bacterium]